jgi:peptide/nickel transport system substrate-binding protein
MELVHNAHEVFSHDAAQVQLFPNMQIQVWRTDQVNIDDQYLANAGFTYPNPAAFANADVEGNTVRSPMVAQGLRSLNHFLNTRHAYINFYSMGVNSCLLEWDQNYELQNVIADNVEANEDATRFLIELNSDATFHNGDKVTAEDVHWTYNFMQSTIGEFPHTSPWPVDEMNVIDNETFEITCTEPAPYMRGQVMTK